MNLPFLDTLPFTYESKAYEVFFNAAILLFPSFIFFQFCFEIYAPNSGSVIKACKTDSDGKVVVGKSVFLSLTLHNRIYFHLKVKNPYNSTLFRG